MTHVVVVAFPPDIAFYFLGLMGNGRWLHNFIPVQLQKRILKEWAMEGQFWHVKHSLLSKPTAVCTWQNQPSMTHSRV